MMIYPQSQQSLHSVARDSGETHPHHTLYLECECGVDCHNGLLNRPTDPQSKLWSVGAISHQPSKG